MQTSLPMHSSLIYITAQAKGLREGTRPWRQHKSGFRPVDNMLGRNATVKRFSIKVTFI